MLKHQPNTGCECTHSSSDHVQQSNASLQRLEPVLLDFRGHHMKDKERNYITAFVCDDTERCLSISLSLFIF